MGLARFPSTEAMDSGRSGLLLLFLMFLLFLLYLLLCNALNESR